MTKFNKEMIDPLFNFDLQENLIAEDMVSKIGLECNTIALTPKSWMYTNHVMSEIYVFGLNKNGN